MEKLITIRTFSYPHELAIIRSRLESEGIPCFVRDELTVQIHNFYSNAIGGVKLEVRASDAERALEILGEMDRAQNLYVAEEKAPETYLCPKCGSEHTRLEGFNRRLAAWFMLLLGFPLRVKSARYECLDCAHRFRVERRVKDASS